MKTDQYMRQQMIDYIVANETTFVKANFDNHSLTHLVIIKVELEVKKIKSAGNKLYA